MKINYQVKNHRLAEDFKEIAEEKIDHFASIGINLEKIKVEVVYEESIKIKKNNHRVTISVNYNSNFFKSEGKSSNDLKAFDIAYDKLSAQVRKHHEKIISNHSA